MGLVDTLVAGRISTTALAGLGLAANCFWTFTSVCMGCLLALDTYFSQAVGARDHRTLKHYLGQSFWASALMTVVAAAGVVGGSLLYLALAPASGMREAFALYMRVIVWCVPSLFFYFVLQRYWQAQRRVVAFALFVVAANVLNLVACFGLGLGRWGLPRLEVQGLALATLVSRYAMLLAAAVYTGWRLKPASLRLPPLNWYAQRALFRLGLPAAGHTALEIGAFTVATFVVGALGAIPLAAHHVCLMMAAFTFMFPLGFSSAAAVRVGTFIGAGRPDQARVAGWLCIGLSITVMSGFAAGYLLFSKTLLGWFTQDSEVIHLGTRILMLVALFQIADGTQVSTTGALRGLGNTRAAMIANLLGHYPIGLALGLLLCFGFGYGAVGIWTGLAAGLISVAVMLLRAWLKVTRDLSSVRSVVPGPGKDGSY
jgi:multidrug resistance protein, MATE family